MTLPAVQGAEPQVSHTGEDDEWPTQPSLSYKQTSLHPGQLEQTQQARHHLV